MKTPTIFSTTNLKFFLKSSSWSPPTFTSTAIFNALFLWLYGILCHNRCFILLNDIMDLYMPSLGTAVTEGPCYMFYETKCEVYWGTTHAAFCWYCDLILYTHKDTQRTQGPKVWHTHINIYQHKLPRAHSSYLHYTE